MKLYKWLVIKNIIAIICFTILAVCFDRWWIVLFSLLFLTLFDTEEKKGDEKNEHTNR